MSWGRISQTWKQLNALLLLLLLPRKQKTLPLLMRLRTVALHSSRSIAEIVLFLVDYANSKNGLFGGSSMNIELGSRSR